VHAALRPGGAFAIWLYGREGNRPYLAIAEPLRWIARRLPHPLLAGLTHALSWPLALYIGLCRMAPLPLWRYMRNVFGPMSWSKRRLIIYDQLNPAYARYYRRDEAEDLLRAAGFEEVQLHHRHGYSWTVIGWKRATQKGNGETQKEQLGGRGATERQADRAKCSLTDRAGHGVTPGPAAELGR
jgi:hypothetical protein